MTRIPNLVVMLALGGWVGYGVASNTWRSEGYRQVSVFDIAYDVNGTKTSIVDAVDNVPVYQTNDSPTDYAMFQVLFAISLLAMLLQVWKTATVPRRCLTTACSGRPAAEPER